MMNQLKCIGIVLVISVYREQMLQKAGLLAISIAKIASVGRSIAIFLVQLMFQTSTSIKASSLR